MAKIPFSIDYRPQIESGEYKVETRDGRKVRIVCWDMINTSYNDILALVSSSISGNENAIIYYQDGKCKSDSSGLGRKDLVIITPEPEFTKFEEAVGELIKEAVHNEVGDNAVVYAIGRGWTDKLLELAKKELVKEGTSKNEMGTMLYDAGFEDGKEEALKDLPKWKKANKDMHVIRRCLVNWDGEIHTSNFIPKDSYYIPIIELEFLLKEE